jgi:hypothetical protein
VEALQRQERLEWQEGPDERDRQHGSPLLPVPPLLPYFFVDETGFGGGLSTYSFRNHALAPFRVIFT